MRSLLRQLEEAAFKRLGPRDVRKAQVYDFGSRVRNFAGDLAMRAIAKGEPEEEVASASPQVKRALRVALDALDRLAKAIFDTELAVVDITPPVRGRLAAEGLDEAITAAGIRATLERAIEKARAYADNVGRSRFTRDMAASFARDLEQAAGELKDIAGEVRA
ncbi:MAG: hypothetical protein WC683_01490 [bacterium]